MELLRAEVAFAQNRGGDAPLLLLAGGQDSSSRWTRGSPVTPISRRGARHCSPAGWPRGGSLLDVSRAAAARARPAGAPLPRDLLLDGFALIFTEGRDAATPVLRRAVAAFAGSEVSAEEMLRWGWLATRAANFLWDYDSCLEIGARAVQLARDSGALEVLAVADNACGQAVAFGGDSRARRC